ncbi:MAG: PilZ domain-containing protein [Firmicutes bacterium]|nr:PilZ domain-containing protein [Bacillota bacterium]
MRLQHCNKAQIYTVQEEFLCSADVVGDVDEQVAILRFDGSRKDILETEVLVKFLDAAHGVLPCICRLSEYEEALEQTTEASEASSAETKPEESKSANTEEKKAITSTVKCTVVAEHEVIQRRQDVKVSVQLATSASFLDEDHQLQAAEVTILDISAGGMFCLSTAKWSEGQVFASKIFDKTIPVDLEVIRVQDAHSYSSDYPADDSRIGYGCRFINLGQAAESALRKFVYQQQLQKRRRK